MILCAPAINWLDARPPSDIWILLKESFMKTFGMIDPCSAHVEEFWQIKQDVKETLRDFILRITREAKMINQPLINIIAAVRKNCRAECRASLPEEDAASIEVLIDKVRRAEMNSNASHNQKACISAVDDLKQATGAITEAAQAIMSMSKPSINSIGTAQQNDQAKRSQAKQPYASTPEKLEQNELYVTNDKHSKVTQACKYCTKSHHRGRFYCTAYRSICTFCHQPNHTAKACKTRKTLTKKSAE